MSVVGINDTEVAMHIWPPLTTVHLSTEKIGRAAVRMLDALVEEGRLTGEGRILPLHLVARASTAAPSGNKGQARA
jgi:LacI family repressor for deo operon, udp, cdd, tsx, nupC, and nupG